MRHLKSYLPEIKKRIERAGGYVLMLDFDGVISPLTPIPARAFLPPLTKKTLEFLSGHNPIAIISGRALADIKKKVSIKNIIYSGNHGLEWQFNGQAMKKNLPRPMIRAIANLKKPLQKIVRQYPGALLENKQISLALHYRRMPAKLLPGLKQLVTDAFLNFADLLEFTKGKKFFEFRPRLNWNKGHFAELAIKKAGKSRLPIYIGDDHTDENVFKTLPHGITVRVGRKQNSRAKFYLKNISEVNGFLEWLGNI